MAALEAPNRRETDLTSDDELDLSSVGGEAGLDVDICEFSQSVVALCHTPGIFCRVGG